MTKEIALEFSGGIDSLFAAHKLAADYDRIHLLTFKKGYLQYGLNASRPNVELLQSIHGKDSFVFKIIDMKSLFEKMAVKPFWKTSREFGNETAWCIPCRAAMAVMSICYCLENDIPEFTDGANGEQAPDGTKLLVTGDNFPEFLKEIRAFAESYDIRYRPVLYDLNTRSERREALQTLGATIDFNSLDLGKKSPLDVFHPKFTQRVQPICISGYLIHWRRNLLKQKDTTTPRMIVDSIHPKLESTGRDYIREFFRVRKSSMKDGPRGKPPANPARGS